MIIMADDAAMRASSFLLRPTSVPRRQGRKLRRVASDVRYVESGSQLHSQQVQRSICANTWRRSWLCTNGFVPKFLGCLLFLVVSQVYSASPSEVPQTEHAYPSVVRACVESKARMRRLAFGRTGRVSQVLVDPGDTVRQGQLLATMECAGLKADLTEAEAELDVEGLAYARRKAWADDAQARIARQELALAQADLALAELNHDRLEALERSVSRRDFEAAARGVLAARLEVEKRALALEKVKEPVTETDALEHSARQRVRRARIERVRHQLSMCEIASPMNGVVGLVHLHAGEVATAAAPVVTVFDNHAAGVTIQSGGSAE